MPVEPRSDQGWHSCRKCRLGSQETLNRNIMVPVTVQTSQSSLKWCRHRKRNIWCIGKKLVGKDWGGSNRRCSMSLWIWSVEGESARLSASRNIREFEGSGCAICSMHSIIPGAMVSTERADAGIPVATFESRSCCGIRQKPRWTRFTPLTDMKNTLFPFPQGSATVCSPSGQGNIFVITLRLSVQRLRTLQQKKEAQAKTNRRDIATLIEKGKLETARIKVETSAYICHYHHHSSVIDFVSSQS